MKNRLLYITLVMFAMSVTSYAQKWDWARGNTGVGMDGWPVATDNAGNVFAAGVTLSTGNANFGTISVDASSGMGTCIIAKYDPSGKILWAEGSKDGIGLIYNIATDLYGNVYLFGYYKLHITFGAITLTNSDSVSFVYYLVKYDKDGNVIWAKSGCDVPVDDYVGGITAIATGGITTDASGNIYVCSSFRHPSATIVSTTLFNTDASGLSYDIFIAKYDQTGNVIWAKGESGTKDDMAYGITVTPAGDIYIAGDFTSPSISFGSSTITNIAGVTTAYIARFNSTGAPVWATSSGGFGGEYAMGVIADAENNVYLTGGLKDASISYSGTTITNPTPGTAVLYLVKFNPSNNVDWYKTIKSLAKAKIDLISSVGAWGFSIALSLCGVVYVSGAGDSLEVDGNLIALDPNIRISMHNIIDPIFIAGFTTNGTYVRGDILPSGGDDQNGIACDAWGNLYWCSDYFSNNPFVVRNTTLPAGDGGDGGEYFYVARYSYGEENIGQHSQSTVTHCFTGEMEINAPTGFSHSIWSTGDTGQSITVSNPGTYYIHCFDSCSSLSVDSIITYTDDCNCKAHLFVPNAFTPNGDGQDDVFYPRSGGNINMITSFRIYNRWGELLFEKENFLPNDATKAWDGSYKGEPPLSEVFVWVVDGICNTGEKFNSKGSVTIIR